MGHFHQTARQYAGLGATGKPCTSTALARSSNSFYKSVMGIMVCFVARTAVNAGNFSMMIWSQT